MTFEEKLGYTNLTTLENRYFKMKLLKKPFPKLFATITKSLGK